MKLHIFVSDLKTTTKTLFMNIVIESLFSNQYGIEYTWSNNGGDESEIEKMSKEDFAKLLCEHSDGNFCFTEYVGTKYITCKQSVQISEDEFIDGAESVNEFVSTYNEHNPDYCKECLVKYLQSQNKN